MADDDDRTDRSRYWTWCMECGTDVIPDASIVDPAEHVYADCR